MCWLLTVIAALAHTIYTVYLSSLTDSPLGPSIAVSGGKLKTVASVLYAKYMGIPVHKIIIATNDDNAPNHYSKYGKFEKSGIISSFKKVDDRDNSRHNMPLIIYLCNGSVDDFNSHFTIIDVTESKIVAMRTFFSHDFNYEMDHRTALVLAAADSYQKSPGENVVVFTCGSAARLSDDLLATNVRHKRPATHVLSSRLEDLQSFLNRDAHDA